jgi:hypothetical protein
MSNQSVEDLYGDGRCCIFVHSNDCSSSVSSRCSGTRRIDGERRVPRARDNGVGAAQAREWQRIAHEYNAIDTYVKAED